jgi:hypothetical protein
MTALSALSLRASCHMDYLPDQMDLYNDRSTTFAPSATSFWLCLIPGKL